MPEHTMLSEDDSGFKLTAGSKSLIFLFLIGGTLIPISIWEGDQYQGPLGFGPLVMCILMVFLWFPLLIKSLVIGTKAIRQRDGRMQGIIGIVLSIGIIVLLLSGFSTFVGEFL